MSQPLAGKRVVVTRHAPQADRMAAQLRQLGATAVCFPTISFQPLPAADLDAALDRFADYHWLLLTSATAVHFFLQRAAHHPQAAALFDATAAAPRPSVATVGYATQQLFAQKGVTVDFVPDIFTGEQLALGLGDVAGRRILLPRAQDGRPEVVAILRQRGAIVDEIALYETVAPTPTAVAWAELAQGFDVLTFASPSALRHFWQLLPTAPDAVRPAIEQAAAQARIACIGPSTAAEAQKHGLPVTILPSAYTVADLVTAVADYFSSNLEPTL